jgi:hypothetical protein
MSATPKLVIQANIGRSRAALQRLVTGPTTRPLPSRRHDPGGQSNEWRSVLRCQAARGLSRDTIFDRCRCGIAGRARVCAPRPARRPPARSSGRAAGTSFALARASLRRAPSGLGAAGPGIKGDPGRLPWQRPAASRDLRGGGRPLHLLGVAGPDDHPARPRAHAFSRASRHRSEDPPRRIMEPLSVPPTARHSPPDASR